MSINFDNFRGLTKNQISERQKQYGLNVLFKAAKKHWWSYLAILVQEPMLALLLITAVIYFILGQKWDGTFMIAGVLLMIGIDFYQEAKTDRALAALKELTTPKISVIRNGRQVTIDNEHLTVGDILVAQEGERIAGDGIVLAASNFSVDESMLTGESGAVYKMPSDEAPGKNKPTKNGVHTVHAGTSALTGQAVVRVTAIGNLTQYGRIGVSLGAIQQEPTPLQRKTKQLVRIFGITGFISCLALVGIVYATTHDIIDGLLKGLTLAISLIPEELPVIITVFAALGAYRLAKNKALVRHINAIETLGHVTALCTDKTGTLTENNMTLQAMGLGKRLVPVRTAPKDDSKINKALAQTLLACQVRPFDPMDISVHDFARRAGLDPEDIYSVGSLEQEYGFDQNLKFLGHVWAVDHTRTLVIKGSAEQVIALCNLDHEQRATAENMIERMASQGLRVLASARISMEHGPLPMSLHKINNLELLAILGFQDPPKTDAKQAVKTIQHAGIAVRMITGDHPQTALHIAKAVGIPTSAGVMTGDEVDECSPAELAKRISRTFVFARIIPEQKLKIIAALKRNGEIVGMLGDGVNDAPSLKEADAGIAMGMRGTNVAREAADMVLMDDNLQTVARAIHDGRRIFDNIQKSMAFVFTVHIYVILIALLVPLAGLPILLTPIHIVLLELLIDPTCALVFETIPAESDIMLRKPRDPSRPLISSQRFARIIAMGLAIFVAVFGTYLIALKYGSDASTARTLAFSALLWSNAFLVLTSISRKKPIAQTLAFVSNPTFRNVYLAMTAGLLFLTYTPYVNAKFGFASVHPLLLGMTVVIGFIPFVLSELHKWRMQKTPGFPNAATRF